MALVLPAYHMYGEAPSTYSFPIYPNLEGSITHVYEQLKLEQSASYNESPFTEVSQGCPATLLVQWNILFGITSFWVTLTGNNYFGRH